MMPLDDGEKDDYLEWVIEKEFTGYIEDVGWITLKGDKIKRGYADRFLFGPGGRTIIVEFKRTGARRGRRGERLQDHYRQLFAELGFDTRKVVGWNAAAELYWELIDG